MIIYTNEGNPLGLKLLIFAKLAKMEVTVKKVNLNDPALPEIKQLPILQTESGLQLFTAGAIAKYLFPNEEHENVRDQWIEWASTLLAPALAHNMGVGHRADPNALPVLNALVKKLDDTLKKTPFLTGDKPTSADFSVWSLLAPDGTLKGAQNIENLAIWYRKIADFPEVKDALTILDLKTFTFSSLQHSNRFGGLHHVVLPPIGVQDSHLLADSPTHIQDTISDEEFEVAKNSFVPHKAAAIEEPRTVLPKKGERNVLITSALPYVNNVPHLGNIIGCVLSADIFARFSRLCGHNTLFICGTDEYGTATENKALAEKSTPREICDKYFEIHNSIYRWFGIGFDYFGRTTTQEQTEIVQSLFKQIYDTGYIEQQSVEQLLCQKCDRFLADRFVEGTCPHPGCGYEDARGDQCDKCGKLVNAVELIRPRCQVCNTAPVIRKSQQLFLNLPKIEPRLKTWFESTANGWTHNARVITRAWLKEGLKSRCITRDLKWGIPVPVAGFESKVFYVWFDAPIGYISITSRYTKEYKKWWQPEKDVQVELYQFMAKDNVPFHSVMFPATLIALNQGHTLVSHIMATEYLNYEDGKFSKSRGVGVFGNDAQDTGIPADVWRFYLASARPEGQDSSFSWNDLAARNNSELLNNLGNFVNRALVFCEKNYAGTVPLIILTDDEILLLALVNREIKGYLHSMEKTKFRDGIRHILSISRHGNQYMQVQQPWVLFKGTDDEKARAATAIGLCCNLACLLATLLFPFMPDTSRNLYSQLNAKQTHINLNTPFATIYLPPGHKIGKPVPLFSKIEQARIDELKKKYSGPQNETTENATQNAKSVPSTGAFTSVSDAEEAIRLQGEKVRKLKQSGVNKADWQPEVNILLDLKKKLSLVLKVNPPIAVPAAKSNATINKEPEHNHLADLKNEVATLKVMLNGIDGTKTAPPILPSDKVKELEEKIAQQGLKVRDLKASKPAEVWKSEVEVLLALKRELTALTGVPPAASGSGKSKKKK